jgi:hypothetical protein
MTSETLLARFEQALRHGGPTHRVSDVVRLIQDKQAQLWIRGDGVIVTELQPFPLAKTVSYWLAAGNLRDCLALQDQINAWAVHEGCVRATLTGRRGWGRFAAARGWKLHGYYYSKPLGGADVD